MWGLGLWGTWHASCYIAGRHVLLCGPTHLMYIVYSITQISLCHSLSLFYCYCSSCTIPLYSIFSISIYCSTLIYSLNELVIFFLYFFVACVCLVCMCDIVTRTPLLYFLKVGQRRYYSLGNVKVFFRKLSILLKHELDHAFLLSVLLCHIFKMVVQKLETYQRGSKDRPEYLR